MTAEVDDPYASTVLLGRVLSSRTESGIANAAVRVWRGQTLVDQTTSDTEGAFVVAGLRPGVHRLEAEADGFVTTSIHLRKLDILEDDEDVRLVLAPSGRLEGYVTDPSGAAVEGASVSWRLRAVSANDEPAAWTSSDARGRYVFEVAPLEELVIGAHHSRFVSTEALLEERTESRTRLDLRLKNGRTLTGEVRGARGPLSHAIVWNSPPGPTKASPRAQLDRYGVRTNEVGRYQLPLFDGVVQVIAWAEGHQSRGMYVEPTDATLDFLLEPSVLLRVRVQDGAGSLMAGVLVSAFQHTENACQSVTDFDGQVVLTDLAAGKVVVRVTSPVGLERTQRFTLNSDRENELTMELGGLGSIAGHLVDSETKVRITEMDLILGRLGARLTQRSRSPSGSFVLSGIEEGTWTLISQSSGYASARIESVLVGSGRTDLGAIELEPLAEVEGRVSPPPRGALLLGEALDRDTGSDGGFDVEEDGKFRTQLRAGRYEVEIRDAQYRVVALTHWILRPGEVLRGVTIELREF